MQDARGFLSSRFLCLCKFTTKGRYTIYLLHKDLTPLPCHASPSFEKIDHRVSVARARNFGVPFVCAPRTHSSRVVFKVNVFAILGLSSGATRLPRRLGGCAMFHRSLCTLHGHRHRCPRNTRSRAARYGVYPVRIFTGLNAPALPGAALLRVVTSSRERPRDSKVRVERTFRTKAPRRRDRGPRAWRLSFQDFGFLTKPKMETE